MIASAALLNVFIELLPCPLDTHAHICARRSAIRFEKLGTAKEILARSRGVERAKKKGAERKRVPKEQEF